MVQNQFEKYSDEKEIHRVFERCKTLEIIAFALNQKYYIPLIQKLEKYPNGCQFVPNFDHNLTLENILNLFNRFKNSNQNHFVPVIQQQINQSQSIQNFQHTNLHQQNQSIFDMPQEDIDFFLHEAKKYLHGDEIHKDLKIKNDFYIVSYNGINLGYVKYVNGRLKNYYPKGLRH